MKDKTVINHILVPKHSILNEKEIKQLLEKYNISLKQLPFILEGDVAIQDLDAEPGDVIKIVRKSPTDKISVFYRLVVNA